MVCMGAYAPMHTIFRFSFVEDRLSSHKLLIKSTEWESAPSASQLQAEQVDD